MPPASTYSPCPLALAIEEVLWAADVALCVDQAAGGSEKAIGSLCQHEMLPDIPRVACVDSVVVDSNRLHRWKVFSSSLIHLLGDIEGLSRCGPGNFLCIIKGRLGGSRSCCCGS